MKNLSFWDLFFHPEKICLYRGLEFITFGNVGSFYDCHRTIPPGICRGLCKKYVRDKEWKKRYILKVQTKM